MIYFSFTLLTYQKLISQHSPSISLPLSLFCSTLPTFQMSLQTLSLSNLNRSADFGTLPAQRNGISSSSSSKEGAINTVVRLRYGLQVVGVAGSGQQAANQSNLRAHQHKAQLETSGRVQTRCPLKRWLLVANKNLQLIGRRPQ